MENTKFTEELNLKAETDGFTRLCSELMKPESTFCLHVEFRKSFIRQFNFESMIACDLIPCIDIVHDYGFIRFTPIYRNGFTNYVCFSDCWDSSGFYETCWILYCEALEIINKAKIKLEIAPSLLLSGHFDHV
ncbi:MAG TPA: hypothetical protein PLQ82_07785 [Desulfobacteraceae bacterium]|nr:hypothetical protein [Desulfobacteraceae bacterium]